MTQFSWPTCPAPVRNQVESLVADIHARLGSTVAGIYLHGSLALGCFNPDHSDLDLLVLVASRMNAKAKRDLAELLLARSGAPSPIEISVVRHRDLWPWRHPAPFDLHYSEDWRGRFEQALASGSWRQWTTQPQTDPDLAAHVTVARQRGICLAGLPLEQAFPPVPPEDYLDSVRGDLRDALEHIHENPVYAVLNVCRTYGYLHERQVFSKDEGGEWALGRLSPSLAEVVAAALALYRGTPGAAAIDPAALGQFAQQMRPVLADAGLPLSDTDVSLH